MGWIAYLTLKVPIRGQSVGAAISRAEAVGHMLDVGLAGGFDAGSTSMLIRAGHADLLVDTYENQWLEVKSAPYRVDEPAQRYELAKDVAAFANAQGGVLLIGAKTKRTPDGDRIHQINRCRFEDVRLAEYRRILSERIYPELSEVQVELIGDRTEGRGLVLIEVPEQEASRRPFLVSGVSHSPRVSELGVTYATRDADGTIAPRIDNLHLLIRTGIATVRGEA